jgi:uncharacterized protein YgbK (DUF1537 family)
MSLTLGCIADDYTGASDLANTLTKQGLRTIQTIGVPDAGLALGAVDAVVVALKTRSVPADDAVARSLAALAWLRRQGARHIMFKICSTFDSTDAGNIGPVTEALATALDAKMVPVTPAFPETGRTVFQGHLFVGSRPLHESPLKDHPLNPMRDSDLVRVLARQSAHGVGLVAHDIVMQGAEAITARLAAIGAAGMRSAIIDAVSEHDLLALGAAALPLPLSTGASGLGLGLARAARGSATTTAPSDWLPISGPAAIIAGSCSAATLEQIAAIEPNLPVQHLDIDRLLSDAAYGEATLAWAGAHLGLGPILLASSATPDHVTRLKSAHGAHVGERIESALASLAAGLVNHGVRRLIVAGGETSGAVIDRLGVTALEIGREIAPGVPLLRSLGNDTMLFALKSGNFGGRGFFAAALAAMGVK